MPSIYVKLVKQFDFDEVKFMLGVRLDSELEHRLENLCKATGHSKSYYAKKALKAFLDDKEDYLVGLSALERNETTISLEELEQKLGLAN